MWPTAVAQLEPRATDITYVSMCMDNALTCSIHAPRMCLDMCMDNAQTRSIHATGHDRHGHGQRHAHRCNASRSSQIVQNLAVIWQKNTSCSLLSGPVHLLHAMRSRLHGVAIQRLSQQCLFDTMSSRSKTLVAHRPRFTHKTGKSLHYVPRHPRLVYRPPSRKQQDGALMKQTLLAPIWTRIGTPYVFFRGESVSGTPEAHFLTNT